MKKRYFRYNRLVSEGTDYFSDTEDWHAFSWDNHSFPISIEEILEAARKEFPDVPISRLRITAYGDVCNNIIILYDPDEPFKCSHNKEKAKDESLPLT